MIKKHMTLLAAIVCLAVSLPSQSDAQIFFTDNFDYADGDLTTVSGGLWALHSGAAPDIQVVSGAAAINAPGSQDDSRQTGAVMGTNDIWYYAVRFTVEQGTGTNLNPDYFIHLKDDTNFGFNARLALALPDDSANDFSLEIWASSGGDGREPWIGDFMFGEEIIAVVRWNNGTGEATLWVNPVDENSTSVTDDELADAMRATESLALRQDSGSSSEVTVDVVSVGTDFASVLAEVVPAPQSEVVNVDTVNVSAGVLVNGTTVELEESDNVDFSARRSGASIQPVIQVDFGGVTSILNPTSLTLRFEGSVFARGIIVQRLSLFNYDTGSYEEVDVRNASRFTDGVAEITPAGDVTRFVDAATGSVEARVNLRANGARQIFSTNIDQVIWTIDQ